MKQNKKMINKLKQKIFKSAFIEHLTEEQQKELLEIINSLTKEKQ